jgi:glycerophosphoryl diester phosphodiesterase
VGRLRPDMEYAGLFPEQSPRDGERIPELDRVFRACGDTSFVVELKTFPDRPNLSVGGEEMAEAVVAVADEAGVAPRITIEGFDWRGPRHLNRTRPDVRLAWLTRAETVANASVWWGGPHPGDFAGSVPRAVAAEGGPVWAPDHTDLTRDLVNEAHDLGLAVIPWTVNLTGDMARLFGWGVDGIVTDRPDCARQLLAAPHFG